MSTELATSSAAPVISEQTAAIIPLQHHEAFYKLTMEEQERVNLLVNLLQQMEAAPEGKMACSERLALHLSHQGYSARTLQSYFQKWMRANRDWRVLQRKWRGPVATPDEFVEFVRMRSEQNSRGAAQEFAKIKAAWAAGESIPGYGTWRDWYATEFPERDMPERYPIGLFPSGWSKSTLYTKQSSRAQRMLKRRGFAAAKKYLPHVMRDMSGLRFLELIMIDDFETDIYVLARHHQTGEYKVCTCTGLLAIDAATRTIVGFGLKPRFDSEEGKRIAITRSDVQGLLYGIFSDHGLPRDYGCTILCENSAAAITPDFELALQNLLGVQVARTGLIADKTLRNGFIQGGGKWWEKGVIESTFSLAHNMAGAMPGQKGASYELKPADLEAKILYAEKLISIEGLGPEVISQLHVPFLRFEEALDGYTKIFRAMERRTVHKLQGFDEVVDFLPPDGSALITEAQLALLPREQILLCKAERRMQSPVERKAKLIAGAQFVKIAEHVLALLLLTPKKVELRNHKITFVHGAEGFTFADADSPVLKLPEGTKLLAYFDGATARELHCTDLEGRYVGSVKRRARVDIRDQAAIGVEAGEITRLITKHVINPVRARHADEDAAVAAGDAANRALFAQAGVTDETLRKHLSDKSGKKSAALADMRKRLLPPAATPTSAVRSDAAHPSTDAAELAQVKTPGSPDRPAAVASLSARLARQAPARDAFAVNQEALARGIAAEGQKAEAKTALQSNDDIDPANIL